MKNEHLDRIAIFATLALVVAILVMMVKEKKGFHLKK